MKVTPEPSESPEHGRKTPPRWDGSEGGKKVWHIWISQPRSENKIKLKRQFGDRMNSIMSSLILRPKYGIIITVVSLRLASCSTARGAGMYGLFEIVHNAPLRS